jgi:hypothetical protein
MKLLSRIRSALSRSSNRPAAGESTGIQAAASPLAAITGLAAQLPAAGAIGAAGPSSPPTLSSRGPDIAFYRQMSAHPTIALAISIVKSPIVANGYIVQKSDGSVPDDWQQTVARQLDPLIRPLKRDALRALEFGWAGFEKIWTEKSGQLCLSRLKPLLPDARFTEILIDANGSFAGLRAAGIDGQPVDLPPTKSFHFASDGEAGNLLGKSRHENIRRRYLEWEQVAAKAHRYQTKVANILTQIHYPDGTSKDASGADRPNYWIAQSLAASIADGKAVAVPNFFHSSADPRIAAELAGKSAWIIDFKDPGGADHAAGFINYLRYLDSLMFRGWLRPERTGLESDHGSRADAQTHTDTADLDGELIEGELFDNINRQITDDILKLNFGPEAAGSVKLVPTARSDDKARQSADLLDKLLATPQGFEAFAKVVDLPAMIGEIGLPLRAKN